MESRESPIQTTEAVDESSETLFRGRRRGCFSLPCFERQQSTSTGLTWWQRIRPAETSSLWSRGVGAVMKIREWSELVAGPRWKTFIRRFNRNRSVGKHANFQYDPLSYAMNFDEGPGHSGDFTPEGDDVDGYYYASRNFSSRYAKGSMDLGNDGPTFV
ncbi:uncharacterized protein LOC131021191 [Salvia miltiorrhiza]|uniref:uncharacterized protein LOC131021191 n=1 Tax=Salvia miltiorrhiza TaxID=226208 RepID=UPI0025AD7416|nr:uncharacterized protein LOC131021191 [Salvia miltiorrhiza]XP_057806273.1 uncharacterized protein LOC131021191 [Salvia miltiorrhiza]